MTAAGDVNVCALCQADLQDGTETFSLKCAHVFHKACFDDLCTAKGVAFNSSEVYDMVCPECRSAGVDLNDGELALLQASSVAAGEVVQVDDGPDAQSSVAATSPTNMPSEAPAMPVDEEPPARDGAADADAAEMSPSGMVMPRRVRAATAGFAIESVEAWNAIVAPTTVITCMDCGQECAPVRCVSKSEGSWRCGKCQYTHTRLFRDHGTGYRQQLATIDDAKREEFFRSAKGQSAKEQRESSNAVLDYRSVRDRVFELGGAFKPLSVWERMGYDGAIIALQSLPEDVMPSRMFGLVYRVPELTVASRGYDRTIHTHTLRADERQATKRSIDDGASSRSSSSSSRSSTDPKKREKKKARKEARQKKRLEQQRKETERKAKEDMQIAYKAEKTALKVKQKEDAKRERVEARAKAEAAAAIKKVQAKSIALAKGNATKLERAVASVQKTLRAPGASLAPGSSKAHLCELVKHMQDLLHVAQLCGENVTGYDPKEYTPPGKDVFDEAKKHEALFLMTARTYAAGARDRTTG